MVVLKRRLAMGHETLWLLAFLSSRLGLGPGSGREFEDPGAQSFDALDLKAPPASCKRGGDAGRARWSR